MTKQEFISAWSEIRTAKLREIYANDPHGPACLAMSLADLPGDCEKLWRKWRHSLKTETLAEFNAKYRKVSQ